MGGVRPANSATGQVGGRAPPGGWFWEGQRKRLKGTRTCRLTAAVTLRRALGTPSRSTESPQETFGDRVNGESARPANSATGRVGGKNPPGRGSSGTGETASSEPTRLRRGGEWGASAQRTAPRGGRVGKTHPGRVVPGGAKGAPERHKNLPPSSSLRVTLRRALATPSRSTESPQETFADRMNGESARPANSATGRAGGKAPPGGWFWEGQRKRLKGTRACRLPTASG